MLVLAEDSAEELPAMALLSADEVLSLREFSTSKEAERCNDTGTEGGEVVMIVGVGIEVVLLGVP